MNFIPLILPIVLLILLAAVRILILKKSCPLVSFLRRYYHPKKFKYKKQRE